MCQHQCSRYTRETSRQYAASRTTEDTGVGEAGNKQLQALWVEMLAGAQAHKAPAWVQSECWWWGFNAVAALTWDCAPGGLVPAVRGWTLRAELGGWPCPGREGVRAALCSSAPAAPGHLYTLFCVRVCVCVWCPGPDSPFNRDPCCVGLGHT